MFSAARNAGLATVTSNSTPCVQRGQKIAYVVDLAYDEQNIKNVVALARDADQLFIEAPFFDVDANIAAERTLALDFLWIPASESWPRLIAGLFIISRS